MYDKTRNNIEKSENTTGETSPHADMRPVAITKREAILLLHSQEHFPRGFDPGDLAISLGWSVDEVHEALLTCVALGLLKAPPGIEALLVKGVPGFVHGRAEGIQKKVATVTRCEAGVPR